MKIVNAYPPNHSRIAAALDVRRKGIVYTYGDTIYAPGIDGEFPEHLIAHEKTHQKQQGNHPEQWWTEYLANPQFRLEQELAAYRVQYQYLVEHHSRQQRRQILKQLAQHLSSEFYGKIIDKTKAKSLIMEQA